MFPSHDRSLYEYNIDRAAGTNPLIYPFVTKQGSGNSFKTISAASYSDNFSYGDTLTSSYPLSASITREYITSSKSTTTTPDSTRPHLNFTTPLYRHFFALKNRLNFYGTLSQHYKISSPFGNKLTQNLNLISIPSIFYGNSIKKGSVSLKSDAGTFDANTKPKPGMGKGKSRGMGAAEFGGKFSGIY